MKLDADNNEIKYDGTYSGTISLYLLSLDGEPTMHIVCDSADPEKVIRIRPIGALDKEQTTNGRFTMTTKLLEDPEGMPLGTEHRVDEKSVYTYVIPRMHVLLGRLLRAA